MTAPLGSLPTVASTPKGKADPDKLLNTAKQLEAMFVRQLYQAMRATAADNGDGVMSGGSAGETFQQLFDEHIADQTPAQWTHGLAEAVARQFARAGMVADTRADTAPDARTGAVSNTRAGAIADTSSGRPAAPTEIR